MNPIDEILKNISIIQKRGLLFSGIPYFAVNEKVKFGTIRYDVISSKFNNDIGWTYGIKNDVFQYDNIREIFLTTANKNHKFKFMIDIPLRLKKNNSVKGILVNVTYDYLTKLFINIIMDNNHKIIVDNSRNYFFDDELEGDTEHMIKSYNFDSVTPKKLFDVTKYITEYKTKNPFAEIPSGNPEFKIGDSVYRHSIFIGTQQSWLTKIEDITIKNGEWMYKIQPKLKKHDIAIGVGFGIPNTNTEAMESELILAHNK